MRPLLVTICCLFFSGVLQAQTRPQDNAPAAAAERSTPQFSLLAYSGPGAATAGSTERLSAGSLAAPLTASQSNQFDQDVTTQMQAFDSSFSSRGLSRAGAIVRGGLNAGRQTEYNYNLSAGQNYGFAGVCDRDCSDLDLVLVNSDGEVVQRDVLADDKPVITYRPTRSGQYRLRVVMAACSQSPCRFGFAAYVPPSQSSTTNSGTGSGSGTSTYDQMVTTQMQAFDRSFSSNGLSRSGAIVRGGLNAGRQLEYNYNLVAGQSYGFAGVCDQDCSDLDLVLVNAGGKVVKEDTLVDDKPVITFSPSVSGTYRLQVRMAACSQSPCRFGFAAYVPAATAQTSTPAADSVYDRMVTQQMQAFDTNFASRGLSRAGGVVRGGLNAGRQIEYNYNLAAGQTYGFAAVCDQDCSDLDLVLVNSDGEVVQRDVLDDDKPIVLFSPTRSGQYRLRVVMAACSQSPCRFGLAAYRPREL